MDIWFEIAVVVGLVLLNGFFAMAELALVSSRPGELKRLAGRGNRGARIALDLLADPGRLLSAVQIGITMVGIVAGAYSGARLAGPLAETLAGAGFGAFAEEASMVLVVGAITYLSLVVGELVPKRLALTHAEAIAIRVAPVMRFVAAGGGPLVWLLRASTEAMLKVLGQHGKGRRAVTEDEVRSLIAEGALAGIIAPVEKEMMDRVMRLADRSAASMMTPRPDVVWLDLDLPHEALKTLIAETGHSRYPVARGGLDDLVGVLDVRLLLSRMLAGEGFDPALGVRDLLAVHESTPAPRLFELFKEHPAAGMAVVLDEYGGLEGIVTLSDILEAIAGELPSADEDQNPSAVQREDGSWLIDGGLAVAEVESLLGLPAMGTDFHTLAGFILAQLKRLPEIGEHFTWEGWRFEVIDLDGRRIDRVLVEPPAENAG